jgi:hypothetical protein
MPITIKFGGVPSTDFEPPLGNPASEGLFLKSTMEGARSWGEAGGGSAEFIATTFLGGAVGSGYQYDDIGASGEVVYELPVGVSGDKMRFLHCNGDYHCVIFPQSGESIVWNGRIGTAGYGLRTLDIGACVELQFRGGYWWAIAQIVTPTWAGEYEP